MGRRVTLLIATYQYHDAGLRQLTAPARDAESFAAVLQDPDIAGFEVTTLINEPHHRVGEVIGDFYHDRRRDDLTLLYFTGHGLKDGRLCWSARSSPKTSPGHDMLNKWRHTAYLEMRDPGSYHRMLAKAEQIMRTGRNSDAVPFEDMQELIRQRLSR